MATVDIARKFAEHAIKVERILGESGATGNAGRVVIILTMAQKDWGVSQKDVVEATALPKDVVSKLVGSLVDVGLLTQEREGTNSRIKRLNLTDSGRSLLLRVKDALQPPRPLKKEPEQTYSSPSFFDDFARFDEQLRLGNGDAVDGPPGTGPTTAPVTTVRGRERG